MPCYGISLLTADNYQVISAINKAVIFSFSVLSYLVPQEFTFKYTNKLHWSPQTEYLSAFMDQDVRIL